MEGLMFRTSSNDVLTQHAPVGSVFPLASVPAHRSRKAMPRNSVSLAAALLATPVVANSTNASPVNRFPSILSVTPVALGNTFHTAASEVFLGHLLA